MSADNPTLAWIVSWNNYSDHGIMGVFTTKELAEQFQATLRNPDSYDLDSYVLNDTMPQTRAFHIVYAWVWPGTRTIGYISHSSDTTDNWPETRSEYPQISDSGDTWEVYLERLGRSKVTALVKAVGDTAEIAERNAYDAWAQHCAAKEGIA